nr:hypothetical protein Iba_chr02dCG11290 [Ipomoea batatas]
MAAFAAESRWKKWRLVAWFEMVAEMEEDLEEGMVGQNSLLFLCLTSSLTLSSPNTDAQFSFGVARHLSLLPAWRSTSASNDDQRRRRADCSSSPLASCHTQALSINQSSSFLQAGYSESRSVQC